MVRFHAVWLAPVAITILNLGLGANRVMAQTTYTFSANFDSSVNSKTIAPNISEATVTGQSADSPYGLTTLNGLTYSQVDEATGNFSFNTDPTVFGLQGIPKSEIVLFGSGSNKLFGSDNATGTIDFNNLTAKESGTFTIAGGEGIFAGATGTLGFSEVDILSLDPNVPFRSLVTVSSVATVNGSFQVPSQKVPEPRNTTALFCLGVMGVGLLLCRRHLKVAL